MKIELDLEIREPIVWDARDAFIEKVGTKVFYVVPAFVLGLLVGVILWALYILMYKTGNCLKNACFKVDNERTPSEGSLQQAPDDPDSVPNNNAMAAVQEEPARLLDENPSGSSTPSMISTRESTLDSD